MQLLYVANRYEYRAAHPCGDRRKAAYRLRPLSRVEHRLRRGAGARSGVADRDPGAPAAALADDRARHPARGLARTQAARPRSLRARSCAARTRARELPASGIATDLGADRRLSAEGRGWTRPSSARCRRDSGCCKRPHLGGSGGDQDARACLQRRAGRRDVVHEDEHGASHARARQSDARPPRTHRARCGAVRAAGRSTCGRVLAIGAARAIPAAPSRAPDPRPD